MFYTSLVFGVALTQILGVIAKRQPLIAPFIAIIEIY